MVMRRTREVCRCWRRVQGRKEPLAELSNDDLDEGVSVRRFLAAVDASNLRLSTMVGKGTKL
jgi:hypothetical protein